MPKDIIQITHWEGKDLTLCSREELIEIIKILWRLKEEDKKQNDILRKASKIISDFSSQS